MRLLTDQDVYAVTVRFLQQAGHDVVTAGQLAMSRASDSDLLQAAKSDRRILVTRDRDYGALVFVEGLSTGVIYLRMTASTIALVHSELSRVLTLYSESELLTAFVVVEPGRHRLRRLVP